MIFKPYLHQTQGISWILKNPACGLFWSMGLGKSVTTLTAIDLLLNDYLEDGPVLIIAPKRVAENTWTGEAEKWDHLKHLRVRQIMGDRKKRLAALDSAQGPNPDDIYVINRENVVWLCETLNGYWPFPIVVIDELSSFKSREAKRWQALRRVRGRIRRIIGLTGTPRPNGLEDLWPEIYLLDRGERLGRTLGSFRSQYLVPAGGSGYIVYSYAPKPGAEEEVYEKISDICMSVDQSAVKDLPDQIYTDIVLPPDDALLKKYRKFEREQVMACLDEDKQIVAMSAAALTNKLLQFANGAVYDEDRKVHEIHGIKLDALEELVEAADSPVLIMYSYRHDLERILQRINARVLDKPKDIEDWNAGRIPVAIAHPASVGHGLNLQSGGHILIWFGLPWSLELYQQANERLHRPGQQHTCLIYHLILKGTHDERVLKSLQKKEAGQAAALEALRLDVLREVGA